MTKNNNALVVVENLDMTVVFSDGGMTNLLDEIKTKAMAYILDVESDQGRKDIVSLAYKITRSKTLIDNLGKSVVSDWKKKAKQIDNHRKTARDFLDHLKDEVRQPLTNWEAEQSEIKAEEEAKEKAKIETRVSELFAIGVNVPFFDLAMLSDDEYAEKFRFAKIAYSAEQLRIAEEEKQLEAERLELGRLRKREEFDRKLESDRLEKLAEAQKVEAKRLEKIQDDIDKKEQALKEEQDKLESDKKAEQARKDLEILEAKLAEEAKAKAEKDKIKRVAREAKELKKKELAEAAEIIRQEALRPDRDKLIQYAVAIIKLVAPDVKDEQAQEILDEAQDGLGLIASEIMKQVKEM